MSGHADGARAGGNPAALSTGSFKGTLTRATVGGERANVVRLPKPLTEAERRKLHRARFLPVIQNGETYYCRHLRWTQDGWMKDCFMSER